MAESDLIKIYADIHAEREYGNTSIKNLRYLRPAVRLLNPASVIDYGCGQSDLINKLGLAPAVEKRRYDPAIPEYSKKPAKVFDLLINIDVLEHIPEADIDPMIEEMRALCRNAIFIVDTVPAKLILPNGQNAHVTIEPKEWWAEKLGRQFPILTPIRVYRPWRAAFRTWNRSLAQEASFRTLRAGEELMHVFGKMQRVRNKLTR